MITIASSDTSPHVRVVTVSGDVDLSLVALLRFVLTHALGEAQEVQVDLAELRTIDSAGIRELLRAQAAAARDHKIFGVTLASANARRLLDRAHARGLLAEPSQRGDE